MSTTEERVVELDGTSTDQEWEDAPRISVESSPEEPAEEPIAAKEPRFRATKAEMEGREKAAFRMLQQGPTTINKMSTETKLSYPKTAALVQRLVAEGRVSVIGSDSGKTLYRIDPKSATPKPVRALPNVSLTKFLDHFHPGEELKVVGLHLSEDGPTVEVRVADEIVKLRVLG